MLREFVFVVWQGIAHIFSANSFVKKQLPRTSHQRCLFPRSKDRKKKFSQGRKTRFQFSQILILSYRKDSTGDAKFIIFNIKHFQVSSSIDCLTVRSSRHFSLSRVWCDILCQLRGIATSKLGNLQILQSIWHRAGCSSPQPSSEMVSPAAFTTMQVFPPVFLILGALHKP